MGRLISEDAVIHSLVDYTNGKKTLGQCIDDVPTAYDVENVVEQLSEAAEIYEVLVCSEEEAVEIEEAIAIVRSGGMSK